MAKYASIKTTLYGVFYVGDFCGVFRCLKAGFGEREEAEAWAKQYSKDNFGCKMMIEELKVTVPAWDGKVAEPIVANPLEV